MIEIFPKREDLDCTIQTVYDTSRLGHILILKLQISS